MVEVHDNDGRGVRYLVQWQREMEEEEESETQDDNVINGELL